MKLHDNRMLAVVALASAAILHAACGGGDTRRSTDATPPPPGASDPAAERQVITLTGCVQRGASPAEFILSSVATGGIVDSAPADAQQGAGSTATPESRAQLQAASSYRLMALGDEDLGAHEGKRVTVSGRLAAEAPNQPVPPREAKGTEVERSPTSSTVAGSAPPLRGFYVESIREVADSCSAQ